jgi:hypothetical protein
VSILPVILRLPDFLGAATHDLHVREPADNFPVSNPWSVRLLERL